MSKILRVLVGAALISGFISILAIRSSIATNMIPRVLWDALAAMTDTSSQEQAANLEFLIIWLEGFAAVSLLLLAIARVKKVGQRKQGSGVTH